MATTLRLQDSINFSVPFLKNTPVQISNQEPALRAGNIVLGTMLGPPMKWRFNRREINFAISTAGGTDYVQALNNFGFIEDVWLINDANEQHMLEGAISLSGNPAEGRPDKIAPQLDDNAGNITFRFDRVPDGDYTVYISFQQKAPLLTSTAAPWGPIPDEFSYIFEYGFLSILSLLVKDARFPIWENYFIARLLGAQDGLDDQERAIFLGQWTNAMATIKRSDGKVGSGINDRAKS